MALRGLGGGVYKNVIVVMSFILLCLCYVIYFHVKHDNLTFPVRLFSVNNVSIGVICWLSFGRQHDCDCTTS